MFDSATAAGSPIALGVLAATLLAACTPPEEEPPAPARDIHGPLGAPLPTADPDQLETFERGKAVALRRFDPEEGLGPLVNVSFCGACHERPRLGGSAPRYRDFMLVGAELSDGSFLPGAHGGVMTAYGTHGAPIRPAPGPEVSIYGYRNAIPFFGVGLIAELPESTILEHADPDDRDGDGISGRPNWDRGFVGRFGRKAQTVSIEGFIRGPLNNHLGITTDPLSPEQKARLPVPPRPDTSREARGWRQAAAPDQPLSDSDPLPDPELTGDALFDLVSFAMLLAAPAPEPLTAETERGRETFLAIGCGDCHVPLLAGPRGGLPLYSDLLLHDMGEALADGIEQGVATGSEFRTQPLWGVAPTGPYLHDGRADTLLEAITWHGGEAIDAREQFEALPATEQSELVGFLRSLGGADLQSDGLLAPDTPIPPSGQPGAPMGLQSEADLERWKAGRAAFDRDATLGRGVGPLFNGDSCRACHFDPVIGGGGPLDVNVMRHGTVDEDGFVAPAYGTILHKLTTYDRPRREANEAHNVFEPRNTPTTLGSGLIDAIADETILALQDPMDEDGDGIFGIAHVLPDGRIGRFGWKANVPSLREFVRDAFSAEMGLTVPPEPDHTFGVTTDEDGASDPEVESSTIDAVTFFLRHLAPPRPKAEVPQGRTLFDEVGCADCHVPELPSPKGPVALYSDLLLHVIAPEGTPGIVEGMADAVMFRTPPLWGLSDTAPYLHDGSASTIAAAIEAHQGEANTARAAYEALTPSQQEVLLRFLESL